MKKIIKIDIADFTEEMVNDNYFEPIRDIESYVLQATTAILTMSSYGVIETRELSNYAIEKQIRSILNGNEINSAFIGMIPESGSIDMVRKLMIEYSVKNIFFKPILMEKHGFYLLNSDGIDEMKKLIAISSFVILTVPELQIFIGYRLTTIEQIKDAAQQIKGYGAEAVFIKGGYLKKTHKGLLLWEEECLMLEDNSNPIEFYSSLLRETSRKNTFNEVIEFLKIKGS